MTWGVGGNVRARFEELSTRHDDRANALLRKVASSATEAYMRRGTPGEETRKAREAREVKRKEHMRRGLNPPPPPPPHVRRVPKRNQTASSSANSATSSSSSHASLPRTPAGMMTALARVGGSGVGVEKNRGGEEEDDDVGGDAGTARTVKRLERMIATHGDNPAARKLLGELKTMQNVERGLLRPKSASSVGRSTSTPMSAKAKAGPGARRPSPSSFPSSSSSSSTTVMKTSLSSSGSTRPRQRAPPPPPPPGADLRPRNAWGETSKSSPSSSSALRSTKKKPASSKPAVRPPTGVHANVAGARVGHGGGGGGGGTRSSKPPRPNSATRTITSASAASASVPAPSPATLVVSVDEYRTHHKLARRPAAGDRESGLIVDVDVMTHPPPDVSDAIMTTMRKDVVEGSLGFDEESYEERNGVDDEDEGEVPRGWVIDAHAEDEAFEAMERLELLEELERKRETMMKNSSQQAADTASEASAATAAAAAAAAARVAAGTTSALSVAPGASHGSGRPPRPHNSARPSSARSATAPTTTMMTETRMVSSSCADAEASSSSAGCASAEEIKCRIMFEHIATDLKRIHSEATDLALMRGGSMGANHGATPGAVAEVAAGAGASGRDLHGAAGARRLLAVLHARCLADPKALRGVRAAFEAMDDPRERGLVIAGMRSAGATEFAAYLSVKTADLDVAEEPDADTTQQLLHGLSYSLEEAPAKVREREAAAAAAAVEHEEEEEEERECVPGTLRGNILEEEAGDQLRRLERQRDQEVLPHTTVLRDVVEEEEEPWEEEEEETQGQDWEVKRDGAFVTKPVPVPVPVPVVPHPKAEREEEQQQQQEEEEDVLCHESGAHRRFQQDDVEELLLLDPSTLHYYHEDEYEDEYGDETGVQRRPTLGPDPSVIDPDFLDDDE